MSQRIRNVGLREEALKIRVNFSSDSRYLNHSRLRSDLDSHISNITRGRIVTVSFLSDSYSGE